MFVLVVTSAWLGAGAQEPPQVPVIPPAATPAPQPTAAPVTPSPMTTPQPVPTPEPTPSVPLSQQRAVTATSGLGMYVWRWQRTGPVHEVVAKAKASGISHLIVRASDATDDFYLRDTLNVLLPAAHAAGIKVVAYDPPRFEDIEGDVRRARLIAEFRTPDGHGVDAFAADIEPKWHLLTPQSAELYSRRVREVVGPDYPIVAVVFPPNMAAGRVPYEPIARYFDVLSPMSYWRAKTTDGHTFMAHSVRELAAYGKPVTALGQAFSYDGLRDVSRRGHPPRDEFVAAIHGARSEGAIGMSWWVWEHAEPWVFDVIREFNWVDARPGIGMPQVTPAPTPTTSVPTPVPTDASVAARTVAAPAPVWPPERAPWSARVLAIGVVAALAGAWLRRRGWRPTPVWARGDLMERALVAAERGMGPLVGRSSSPEEEADDDAVARASRER